MTAIDTFFSARVYFPKPYPRTLKCKGRFQSKAPFLQRPFKVVCNLTKSEPGGNGKDDFMTRTLKENPSQVEPRYLIGEKFYTLKAKEDLNKNQMVGFVEFFLKKLNFDAKPEKERNESLNEGGKAVYLKDILREYQGKLYVPEQVFIAELSEEEEFDRNLEVLPKMSFEDFKKAMKSEKVKLLTSKELKGSTLANGHRDFIVDLKEIPGEKSLHRIKWALRLDEYEAQELMEEYVGPHYEIAKHMTASSMGKLPEYPHPVARYVSSRMMVELGMVTAVMAAAAAVVGGFLASALFTVTSFIFMTTVYVVWPMVKNFFMGTFLGISTRVLEYLDDILSGGRWFSPGQGNTSASIADLHILPLVLFAVLFLVFIMRYTLSRKPRNFKHWDLWQGINFSRSKAEARVDGSTGVKFSDVAGIDEAVEELQELVRYLKNPELFDKMGIKPPHGVLLEGPPGCGKTLVAKAIAGEAGVPFYQMAGSEFTEVLVGVGSARVRDLFKRAKVNKPSVIFIDEVDALGTRRLGFLKKSKRHVYNAATQERETTLNQLLIELDGFDTGKGVIFLAATNRKDLLDPALLRPGRFDRKIRIRPPNAKGRLEILKIYASKVKMSESVDLATYAKNLTGWSGARLAQLVQEAAIVAVRQGHASILQSDMDDAVERLTIGPKRLGVELGHQGQCRRATTEVGVAMTSHLLRRYENAKVECCDRISIIPRGRTLSQVVFKRLDDESYTFERQPQLLHRLQVLLGGRAAEEVIYGRDTSKSSVRYLADASWLARKIITIWNLENPLVIHGEPPPWKKKMSYVGPRLDFEGSLYNVYGLTEPPINLNLEDEIAQRTEDLIRYMYGRTVSMLRRHHVALLKAVKVLLNQKEISGTEIDYILNNYPPQSRLSLLLEEENPGSLPLVKKELGHDSADYALLPSSDGETP
nr:AAA-type ATPase family protein [Passiflora pittieri]